MGFRTALGKRNAKDRGVESIDSSGGNGECGANGGYWIDGDYGAASSVNVNSENGTVTGTGYDSNGNLEYSIAGAAGSNDWGAWTQTFSSGSLISGLSLPNQLAAANNGSWWGTFGSTFFNGVLHGVRQPGQSFTQCVLQNANETTGGAHGALVGAVAATAAAAVSNITNIANPIPAGATTLSVSDYLSITIGRSAGFTLCIQKDCRQ